MMRRSPRTGVLALEALGAFAVLSFLAVIVAQLVFASLAERSRAASQQDALEAVINQMEAARAMPWDALTPAWATEQKLPAHLLSRWPQAKLAVRVEPEPSRPRVKRVNVELTREGERPVALTALFADRVGGGAK